MKGLAHILYGMVFHLLRICPVKKKKAVLFMIHNSRFQGNLRFVYEEMRVLDPEFQFVVLSKKQLFSVSGKGIGRAIRLLGAGVQFFLVWNYHLATAEYIFLNDNFLPLAYMNVSAKTKVVQLWHGVGAFKKFGLTTETRPQIRRCVEKGNKRITHLFVSSAQVVPYYKEALGVSESRMFPTGVPVTDYYFNEEMMKAGREHFYREYPQLKKKKLLLYTPTFRASWEENESLAEHFDCKRIKEALGEDWAVLIRRHPQIPSAGFRLWKDCYDVTDYEDIKELYVAAHVLVNDYSSTVVEYALLRKPVVLYAYDLASYDRGFYRDYLEHAPGPVARNLEQLIELIKGEQFEPEGLEHFLQMQYDCMDGKASRRAVEAVLEENEKRI